MTGLAYAETGPASSGGKGDAPASKRKRVAPKPGIVLIGASTGGPQALVSLIAGLAPQLPLIPVCVTLHMPRDLMPIVAAHVARVCSVETRVVDRRQALRSGLVYFSPGHRHFLFQRMEQGVDVDLTDGTSHDFCKPAVDLLFASAAASHGARALGIVLSGMGKDGLAGSRAIVSAGGTILVQDKASSAVWGMPGAVAKAELASAILDPAALAAEVVRRMQPGSFGR